MITPEITETAIGRGVIPLSRGLTRELFPNLFKIDDCTLQGELKAQGIFDHVQRTLLLPDSYTIVGIFYGSLMTGYCGDWLIVVDSPDIPLFDEGALLPTLTPVYVRHSDGTNALVRIDISR